MRKTNCRLLRGADGPGSIGEYLGVPAKTVYNYIKMGMPCVILLNTYHAHIDNIEAWFQRITMVRGKIDDTACQ